MPLPDEHLAYPRRRYGSDQDRYPWRIAGAEPVRWPWGGPLAVTIVVPVEHHTLTPLGKPFKPPGAMVTPYPDLRHYTTRDYGNRVGVFRLLDALKSEGLKATFPVNADQLQRLAPLVRAIADDGHEIAAHGLSADRIHWGGLERETEAAWIAEARARFDAAGLKPRAWLSPARQQSFATLDLISQAGFDVCLDWEMDEAPVAMTTAAGATTAGRVVAVPLSNELDDRTLLIDKRHSELEWSTQVLEAAAYLKTGADRFGGRSLGFTLTPYVSGQPFRIAEVERVLRALAADPDLRCVTASEAAAALATSAS